MMHRAGWLGADLAQLALVDALGNDGLGGVLAGLELRSCGLFFGGGLLGPDFGVLVARQGAALLLLTIGRADLHQLGFRRNGLGYVSIHLGLITGRRGTSVQFAQFGEQELVMAGAQGAFHTTACGWHQLRVALVERRELEDKKDVGLNPELEAADGEQDAFRLLPTCAPILFEASGQRRFLLSGLEFGQQKRMANADLLAVEGFDHYGRKLGQLQTSGDIRGIFSGTRGQLFDGIFRLVQGKQPGKTRRLFHRMHIGANEVLNERGFHRFGVGKVDDADGHGRNFGYLRGAVAPCSGHDLKAAFIQRPHQQR